jgi:hypothetical protein
MHPPHGQGKILLLLHAGLRAFIGFSMLAYFFFFLAQPTCDCIEQIAIPIGFEKRKTVVVAQATKPGSPLMLPV